MLSGARSDSSIRSQVSEGRFQSVGSKAKLALGARPAHAMWLLETAGSDNTGEWWLVSTSANLFVGNAGPLRCSAHCD